MKHTHHKHSHSHSFDPPAQSGRYIGRAFAAGIILNIAFVGVEFITGLALDSVALMSDAGHNLGDVVSLALSLMAFKLAKQKSTERYTYGRKKSTIIVSLANACILLVAIGIIIVESIGKLRAPQPVEGGAIAWVAGVGVVINAFTAWLFMRHRKNDLNINGAYLHMAADALVSVGVLVSGIVIAHTGWYVIDPIVGLVVAAVILLSTWGLLRDSLRLSLDGVPIGIDSHEVAGIIRSSDPNVADVHHIHIWALSTTENALTAHVAVRSANGVADLKCKIKKILKAHGIGHSTIEIEFPGEKHCGICDMLE